MKNIHSINTITFEIAQTEKLIREAKQLCHDVYLQVGYIDKAYPDRIIPHEYDVSSNYIVALNSLREVIGTIRLTLGPPFATLNIWINNLYTSSAPLITDAMKGNSFEVGALAVRKDWCTIKISWGLYKAAYHYAISMKMDYAIISMDARALRSMQMLGWQVIQIGEPMNYFGSLTVPGIMPVSKQPMAVQSKNQSYHQYLAA